MKTIMNNNIGFSLNIKYKDENGVVNIFSEGDEVICCVGEDKRFVGMISSIGFYQEADDAETELAMYIDTSMSKTSYSGEVVRLADITYICKNPLK